MNINKEASVCRTRRQVLISTASIVFSTGFLAFLPKSVWAAGEPQTAPADWSGHAVRAAEKILEACCRCVKPGGRLVYSTCTVSKRENADTVQSFLMNHTEFTAVSPFDCVDSNKLRQNEDIRRRSADGMLQLFPNLDGMDGFFIAAAVKSGAEMRNAKSEP